MSYLLKGRSLGGAFDPTRMTSSPESSDDSSSGLLPEAGLLCPSRPFRRPTAVFCFFAFCGERKPLFRFGDEVVERACFVWDLVTAPDGIGVPFDDVDLSSSLVFSFPSTLEEFA